MTSKSRCSGSRKAVGPRGAFYRVADGRVVDFWINWDVLGILEQIGGVRRAKMASV